MAYDNLKLEKGLYSAQGGFTQALEQADPSVNYIGTPLEGLDAYERQLKRFGIRVSGAASDRIEKFFRTSDSATLFPEYAARAVRQGLERADALPAIVAATTMIDGTDYRSMMISSDTLNDGAFEEMSAMNTVTLKNKGLLVNMRKYGGRIGATYEAIRYHRLDLFTVMLRNIGAEMARRILVDAVDVLINGDGNPDTAASTIALGGDSVTYDDLLTLWNAFDPFTMTTLIAGPGTAQQVLALDEMRDARAGLDFHGTGKLLTPLGAELIKSTAVPAGKLLALDKNAALELVKAGDIVADYDKMIERQLEFAALTGTIGFAKIYAGAAVVLG